MKTVFYPITALIIVVTAAFTASDILKVEFKDNFLIKFESKDPSGVFDEMNGTIEFDGKTTKGASFDLSFPVNSINTGNKMKDKKAQTSEWFDAKNHPNVEYKSTSVEKTEKGFLVKGELTIKGTTKEYNVPMFISNSKEKGTVLYGAFKVNRMDFKVGKPSKTVPDNMNIKYFIPITKTK